MHVVQKGFTLIELMIVVAIIAILSAIALPVYVDYTTRAQVAEVVSLTAGLKSPIETYAMQQRSWPTIVSPTATITASNQIAGTLAGKFSTVSGTIVGTYPSGTITGILAAGRASGQTLQMVTADGGVSWSCSGGTIDSKWRPQACR